MIQDLKTYLANKERYQTTPYIINSEGAFFLCKDLLIPEHEFCSLFPLADKVRVDKGKGENIGSAKI